MQLWELTLTKLSAKKRAARIYNFFNIYFSNIRAERPLTMRNVQSSSVMQPLIVEFCWNLLDECIVGPRRPQNCGNPLPVKFTMAHGTQIGITTTPPADCSNSLNPGALWISGIVECVTILVQYDLVIQAQNDLRDVGQPSSCPSSMEDNFHYSL